MKWFILILLMSSTAWAKTVAEPMQIIKMNWSAEKGMYRLTMLKHAAAYWAPKELEDCLLKSIRTKSEVNLSYNIKNLHVSKCQKTTDSD